ncbi:MAG TPA: FecR domain-containing protein [Pseudorhodoferax sp.]|nr:FecR domain-containing protein [Pseudorhodoferax sp.]
MNKAPSHATAASAPADAAQAVDAQEREYADFADGQDPLDIDAATWVSRHRDGLDAAGERELQAWLAADPRHQAAYDDMDETFGRLQDLPGAEVQQLRAGLPAAAAAPVPRPAPRRAGPASPGRRAWLFDLGRRFPQAATAAAVVAAAGGGWIGWQRWQDRPTFENAYAAARGQQLRLTLPDGSDLALDTATQVRVRLYRDRREVHLLEGQAMFVVQADPAQPFHVLAGGLRVTVVGTRFSVRHTRSGLAADQTQVVVEEGLVRVEPYPPAAGMPHGSGEDTVMLRDGQSVRADSAGRLQAAAQVPPGSVAPWREGRVNFDNTPLAQALAELERYGATGLVVRDPAVAALRVGGSFQLRRVEAFAESLPKQLPVRLERRGGVTEVVLAR